MTTDSLEPNGGNSASDGDRPLFRRADLSVFQPKPDRFYDVAYSQTVRAMVQAVLEAEAPVRDDVLAQRIARAHGWQRTGAAIRSHIERHLKTVESSTEEGGRFLWRDGQQNEPIAYRHHATEDDRRSVGDIALVELAALVRENPKLVEAEDPAMAFSRMIGLSRLTAPSRARLDAAIEQAQSR